MAKRLLAATLALAATSFFGAEAQTPTKSEALVIVDSLRPVFFGGRTTSASEAFDFQNDSVVVVDVGVKAEVGQRRRYDPCNGIVAMDSHVKVLDGATIVATRMGSLRVTIVDVSSMLANYTITDVIHRGGADSDWKITYEHVTIWPRDHGIPNDVCNVVRLPQ